RLGGGILVLGTGEVELGLEEKARGLGTLEENEVLVLSHRYAGDEMQLEPQGIQLAALPFVEDQLAQRPVVAEVPLHEVEPGGERPPLAGCFGVKVRAAVGNNKVVRKHRTEALQRSAQPLLGVGVGPLRCQQLRQAGVRLLELSGQRSEVRED